MSGTIAFFDVDHTLLRGNSGFHASLRLVRHGLLRKHRLLQALYYRTLGAVIDPDIRQLYRIATYDTIGLKAEKLFEIGEECLREDLIPRLYPQGLEAIAAHRKKGHYIVLITSGPTMVAEPLARYLKAHACYSIGSELALGCVTGRLPEILCYGKGKVHYSELACERFGVRLQDCHFYTDHHSDIPLLEAVGFPHVVNPDPRLYLAAWRHKWPIEKYRLP